MSIRISPATFVFKGPLTSRLVRRMRIENNGHRFLAFKIKTTSPKSYGVLPTNGIISPNSEQVILVKKFAIKQEPDITLKFNDKFMVLIAYVDIADIKKSIDSMWQQIETRPDQAIKSVLIPCLYQGTVTDTSSISSSPAVFEVNDQFHDIYIKIFV
ncbi:PapD-like protein [Parasitella parasitica]|nr:PapD-like protein [Parasitella parasitica]